MHRVSAICLLTACAAFALCAFSTDDVCAQTNSLFGSRGSLSQPGSGTTGGLTAGNRTLTGTGLGQSTTGGTSGLRSSTTSTGQGFTGRGDNAGQFVGNRLANQGSTQQTNTRQLGNQRSQLNRSRTTGASNRLGNQTDQNRRVIRPRQQIAFAFPKLGVTAIDNSLQTRVKKLTSQGLAIRGVTWAIDEEGLVILRGEVDSERTRKLAALLVRLEPGVRTVQNELTLKAGSSTK